MKPLRDAGLVAFVGVTDMARGRAFYEGTLGLELVEESPFACEFRTGSTSLRVTLVEEAAAAVYTVLGWAVADIAATIAELEAQGVELDRFDGMEQDELGAWTAPGGARVAWFTDPDGNRLSITQFPAG
jgi:catechol 2,3-dioxygenase-like lactoylglutathione lyase family enzyme